MTGVFGAAQALSVAEVVVALGSLAMGAKFVLDGRIDSRAHKVPLRAAIGGAVYDISAAALMVGVAVALVVIAIRGW